MLYRYRSFEALLKCSNKNEKYKKKQYVKVRSPVSANFTPRYFRVWITLEENTYIKQLLIYVNEYKDLINSLGWTL